ncbi:MAG: hypothetical protein EBU08_15780 [Micrococcales bacterium]|nr:hypothetical protein [Micrococcales bacterium]
MLLCWQTKEVSIGTFCAMISPLSTELIDTDPEGQRPDIESLSKKQGIIDTVLRGYDFGELKLRTLIEAVRITTSFKYRSIDGGHRKRSIRDFINNKFKTGRNTVAYVNGQMIPVGNKFFKELPSEVKEQFSSYKIRFTIYNESMTDEQAGEIFRRTNITTDVNHQEMLNSYEDNLVARFVRYTSRPVVGLGNKYHALFEYKTLGEDRKQVWFSTASSRLRDDEFVTRFLTMLTKDEKDANWLTSSNKEMEKTFIRLNRVWSVDPKQAKQDQKMVTDALDFMLAYAQAKKAVGYTLLSTQEFTMVARFYVYLVRTFGRSGFKVASFEKLYNSMRGAMDRFVGRDDDNLRIDTHKDSKGVRLVCECFRQYLTVHDDMERSEQSVRWLLEEMDIQSSGIIFTDTARAFTRAEIEEGLRKQGGVDWIYGEPLNIKDAAGGHIVPHSEGGTTTMDNLCVITKEDNQRMGSMDAHLYKAMVISQLEKV